MARRGKRRPLAPNISEDDTGRSVIVTIAGKPKELRFPPGTPLDDLEAERNTLQRRQQAAKPAKTGTLRADVVAYLRTIANARTKADQTRLLAHWVARYGDAHRSVLTPLVIRQQLAQWHRDGAAASSCNHRLSALRAVWRAVADPDESDYPRQVRKLPEPAPEPRALSYDAVRAILAALPDRGKPAKGQKRSPVSLTKLRLSLMAYTGLPPAQIMRIDPATDIDWTTPALRGRPRRKGKGTRETWLPLIPPAVETLRALVAAKGFGSNWSTHAVHASFLRACRHAIQAGADIPHRVDEDETIIPTARPYDLRHSYASYALQASGDLAAVQHLLQHSTPLQTVRYTLSAIPARAIQAATLVAKGLGATVARRKAMAPQPSRTQKARKQARKRTRP